MEGGFDFLEPVELRVELKESIFTNASWAPFLFKPWKYNGYKNVNMVDLSLIKLIL
jgi:hypothetical protein